MTDTAKYDFKHITIIGVGLIGGSFALALKKNGFMGRITGVGRSRANLVHAQERGIIDDFATSHAQGVRQADLVVLASSVGQFASITGKIVPHLKNGAIVTDVGSVKSEVLNRLDPMMPEGVHFVAGHPIAGKECSGIDGADPDLFQNARYIITPGAGTSKAAQRRIRALWKSVGSRVMVMTPEEHDMVFAAVSHMPHVVAYSLINSLIDIDRKLLRYGGGGLKDFTRIALSPEELWRDICAYNRESVLTTLKSFSSSIQDMINFIEASDWEGLEGEFRRARDARKHIG